MQRTAFFPKHQQPLQFLEVAVHEGVIVIHEGLSPQQKNAMGEKGKISILILSNGHASIKYLHSNFPKLFFQLVENLSTVFVA